ncbi:predicted protein [Chaetomium globosum CBS 148.51]|uniref:Reverse transcriptase domain-containing protein n=1 Tax=Chaetomium globosum (strain ATCC 6205 / CBS 148.51 / DSM 1962 / NBRC 6347 / NRRL 1970) TaxID=306901 RepID=Q2HEM0_CHAGB|nr:uncharacterized protein CHGG_01334 [Chaetomium globosum CBS 148.51]EAQ93099.1 predicted protein [Chaetomium globosum CBS 148.51]
MAPIDYSKWDNIDTDSEPEVSSTQVPAPKATQPPAPTTPTVAVVHIHSDGNATIAVNGFTSGRQELPQAGLPQGSPLSPVLFLFFNADLRSRTALESKLSSTKALDWEKRSAPVMDYAANVWMHACGEKALSWLNRAQKIGALAITGAFRTAATAVVEAEASIYPVRERHVQAAASLWINIHTLPGTHPLAMKKVRTTVRFVSPLQKIARVAEGVRVDRMETIQEYAVPPWVPRLRPTLEADRGKGGRDGQQNLGNRDRNQLIPEIDFALGSDAKAAAQRASKQGRTPDSQIPQAKSTAMRLAMERQRATRVLPVGVAEAKGGLRIGAAPNRNGETERFFEQDWGGRVRPLCLWTSEGISGTLSFPMREMDSSEGRHAAMHSGKTRKPLVLSGRESAIRYKALVTRYEGSPGDDQIRNGNRKAGAE